jgi:hypothetical protein
MTYHDIRVSEMAQTPSVRNSTQAGENVRKISSLDYKSSALCGEGCAAQSWQEQAHRWYNSLPFGGWGNGLL